MFLKKAAIITLSTLFLTTGCVSTSDPDQGAKITNLENELVQSKANAEQAQLALEKAKTDLEIAQKETEELSKKLEQGMVNKKSDTKNSNVVVDKTSKQDTYLDKSVLGQAEWIYVTKSKQNFKARIDTGAATSSINALDIQRFERDGKKWVRFNITHAKDGKEQMIEARIVRIAKITQSSKPGVETERPVVKLHVRIGNVVHRSEFTLTNRLHMEFPVLIGRTFMQDVVLVDVSQDYIHPKYQPEAEK